MRQEVRYKHIATVVGLHRTAVSSLQDALVYLRGHVLPLLFLAVE